MAEERTPMTKEGYEKLKAELDDMVGRQMIEITKRVAAARDLGDLSENAEYHAAREDQGILQAKINDKKAQLASAYIIDPSNLPRDTVVFGARVKVMDLDLDEEEEFELVSPRRPGHQPHSRQQPYRTGLDRQESGRNGRDCGSSRQDPLPRSGHCLSQLERPLSIRLFFCFPIPCWPDILSHRP
jgi:transcription elongation factor GreA